ncbi:hypothetical protein [Cellulomonas edaphi]|uniref:DUF4352 domain-containing protein n=1 Tax=Cellulomonas edaphi TaxID=3053468 RepID=A0ABT7S5A3_9CELL|nr:hypothetical protein [Cellulomons edaphi]MDM7830694.1 hypothetical protein [Cellulomons edaphi]
MTDDMPSGRRPLPYIIGGAAIVVALLAALAIAGPWRGDDQAEATPTGSLTPSSSASATPTSTPSPTASPTPSDEGPTSDAPTPSPSATSGPPASAVPVPPLGDKKPITPAPSQSASVGGVHVRLVALRAVTTAGTGVGEIAGPGVEAVVEVQNDRDTTLDLSEMSVAVYQGADGIPLSTVTSDPANAPAGDAAAGKTSRGTYRFAAGGKENRYAVVVALSTKTAPVVFQGVTLS